MRSASFGLLTYLALALPALAEVPAPRQMKCPIGGKTFTYVDYAAYSTYGMRLDGKPYGSTTFPLRLPICPDNGFVVLKGENDYTPVEIETYGRVIARDAFKAVAATETSYYRAWYMEREAGEKPAQTIWLLLQATWEADSEPERHRRYQEELIGFIDGTAAQFPHDQVDWWFLQYYAANAERQIGAFDAARKRIAAIRAEGPPETLSNDPDWSRNAFVGMLDTIDRLANAGDTRLDNPDRS